MTALEIANGLARAFEGLEDGDKTTPGLQPYRDPVGLWTIGYGHLLSPDPKAPRPDITITMDEAVALLAADLTKRASAVLVLIRVPLTDAQAAALIDFTYNLGVGALRSSTLRAVINRGKIDEAPKQFRRWVYARGMKLPGLVRRREAEARLWLQ
jgi:lysozyme